MESSPRAWVRNRGWREELGSDGQQPPGLGTEPGPSYLSVCEHLTLCHWSHGAHPLPNRKEPPALPRVLSPGVSWLQPQGQRGAPGLLTRCPSLPQQPAQHGFQHTWLREQGLTILMHWEPHGPLPT